jgi:hypothetical protein
MVNDDDIIYHCFLCLKARASPAGSPPQKRDAFFLATLLSNRKHLFFQKLSKVQEMDCYSDAFLLALRIVEGILKY